VLLVGLMCASLAYGYVLGLVIGTLLAFFLGRGLTGLAR
jgi:tetrahydromethanopterin S-methyltransferase subunit B